MKIEIEKRTFFGINVVFHNSLVSKKEDRDPIPAQEMIPSRFGGRVVELDDLILDVHQFFNEPIH